MLACAASEEYGDFVEQIAHAAFIKMNRDEWNFDHEEGFAPQANSLARHIRQA